MYRIQKIVIKNWNEWMVAFVRATGVQGGMIVEGRL